MDEARGGIHGRRKQRKSMARLLADREANQCSKARAGLRTLARDALGHLQPSSSLWLASPTGASSVTALQVQEPCQRERLALPTAKRTRSPFMAGSPDAAPVLKRILVLVPVLAFRWIPRNVATCWLVLAMA